MLHERGTDRGLKPGTILGDLRLAGRAAAPLAAIEVADIGQPRLDLLTGGRRAGVEMGQIAVAGGGEHRVERRPVRLHRRLTFQVGDSLNILGFVAGLEQPVGHRLTPIDLRRVFDRLLGLFPQVHVKVFEQLDVGLIERHAGDGLRRVADILAGEHDGLSHVLIDGAKRPGSALDIGGESRPEPEVDQCNHRQRRPPPRRCWPR